MYTFWAARGMIAGGWLEVVGVGGTGILCAYMWYTCLFLIK